MHTIKAQIILSTAIVSMCFLANAEDGASRAAIEQSLIAKYALTKPTADNSDIVTAGSILTLQKDNLVMVSVAQQNPYQNTYKNGMITQNALSIFRHLPGIPGVPGAASPASRTFVAGEKMWLTRIEVKEDGVVFSLFTDAISDVRYKAALKFALSKGSIKAVDQVDNVIGQVFTFQAPDNSNAQTPQQAPAPGQAPTPAPAQRHRPLLPMRQSPRPRASRSDKPKIRS